MTTFNHWQLQRLIPEPVGINKRQATWDDSIMETVNFIQTSQGQGMSLDAIKTALPGFYLEQSTKAQARAAFLAEWMDLDKAKAELADLFDCSLAGASILLTEGARAWVVSIDGQTFTLAEVERASRVIVHYAVINLEDYLAIVTAGIRAKAGQGIVLTDLGNMAHRVFTQGEDIKEMVQRAKELNALTAELQGKE